MIDEGGWALVTSTLGLHHACHGAQICPACASLLTGHMPQQRNPQGRKSLRKMYDFIVVESPLLPPGVRMAQVGAWGGGGWVGGGEARQLGGNVSTPM